jgi:alkaline phosphatase D
MFTRRRVLQWLGIGCTSSFFVGGGRLRAALASRTPLAAGEVFDLSVASGDPTPSGVVLWTHIAPLSYRADEDLLFEVARDPDFAEPVLEGSVSAANIGPHCDYTAKVDLDGLLPPDARLYYRFVYRGVASRTGRCRTCPPPDAVAQRLRLAVLSCQDFTNGYYGVMSHVAEDTDLDFVLHLGDFIYESAGDPSFQDLPFADRAIVLPSRTLQARDLSDYRSIYRTYRSDPQLQRALEQHTWIIASDDHETANDCYWDYQRDTLGAPDHPFQRDPAFGNQPELLRQLKRDAQTAWLEYVPARVPVDAASSHPHRRMRSYRSVQFGDLVDLFVLDSRTYRTPHPCGENRLLGRYLPLFCGNAGDRHQSMLGAAQRDWLVDGLHGARGRWQVLGNQTLMAPLRVELGELTLPLNTDAWDGYAAERQAILRAARDAGVDNLVVLTGDLHSYTAAHLASDFRADRWRDTLVGVEFMTPSVTSANLRHMLTRLLDQHRQSLSLQGFSPDAVLRCIVGAAVRLTNPHIAHFHSDGYGYSTVEFHRDHCEWTAFAVDKDASGATARRTVTRYRKRIDTPQLEAIRG